VSVDEELTWNMREYILDRYEIEEILDILGLDADAVFDYLEDTIKENIDKFDIPTYYEV
jgi:hypothetical protein